MLDIMGGERTGKSDFACTVAYEHPTCRYLALDYNYKGPVTRHRKAGAKIEVSEFFYALPFPPPTSPKEKDFEKKVNEVASICRPIFKRFMDELWQHLKDPKGSIVIDNGTSLYKLCRYAMFGYIHKVPRHLYPKSTNAMTTIINQVRYAGKPTVWIHRQKENWTNDEPDGTFYRDGFKEIGYEVMASLQSERTEDDKFIVKILDSTFNNEVVGLRFGGSRRDFSNIAYALRTGRKREREK